MEESLIKALLTLNTTVIEGTKYVLVPLEDILRKKVSIQIGSLEIEKEVPFSEQTQEKTPIDEVLPINEPMTLIIDTHITKLYRDQDKMTQDVTDYLVLISKCWEYHSIELKPSILKKAASYKPTLNTVMFNAYGKDSDKYLTQLIVSNFAFIQDCWNKQN